MRPLAPVLCVLLAFGCAKSPTSETRSVGSQFAEASLILGQPTNPADPASAPGYLNCTVGLIPAYKSKDAAELALWVFPRSSGQMLSKDCDLANPALQGKRAQILSQSFTGEGALLTFQAQWPGGSRGQIVALDVLRKGRRFDRVFGIVQ